MCPLNLNCAASMKWLGTLLRDNVTLSLEPVILKMAPTCSQHENQCLKMLRDNKTPGGPSVGKLVQREDLSHQNYTKVYFQD